MRRPSDVTPRYDALSLGAAPLVRLTVLPQDSGAAVFRHDVSSGDPLADRIMLWTRVTTRRSDWTGGSWSLATDAAMIRVLARRQGQTTSRSSP